MNSIPTTSELADLGSRIAEDGFASNEEAIAEIVAVGLDVEPDAPSLHVLADTTAPVPVRERALACVGYRWTDIHSQLIERREQFEQSLADLLDVWNQHQKLRASAVPNDTDAASAASVAGLADSRTKLDALRWAVASQRADLGLDERQSTSAVLTTAV